MSKPRVALWNYRASLDSVIDGDTVKLCVDLGFHTTCTISMRLAGIDCPELRGGDKITKMAAKRAKFFTEEWFKFDSEEEWPLIIKTEKDKKSFDRYIGDVWKVGVGESLSAALLKSNNAIVVKY